MKSIYKFYPKKFMDAFFKYVHKTDYCWYWLDKPQKSGYGKFWGSIGNRKIRGIKPSEWVHRISWIHHNQKLIPNNTVIRHKCHFKMCVNPDHLEIGTQKQNIADSKDYVAKEKMIRRKSRWRMGLQVLPRDNISIKKIIK